jgi:restriction endonuclease S subunit
VDRSGVETEAAEGPRELPKGWAWAQLGKLGNWTSGGTPKSTEPSYYEGPIPWFRITELNDGRLRRAPKSLTEKGLASSSAKLLKAPFLMFAMYGASIGKLGISEIHAATNQAIACCQPGKAVHLDYFFWVLKYSKQGLVGRGQGGAQPNISQSILLDYSIPLAPLPEQRRIVERIDALFAEIAAGEAALAEARKGLDLFRRSLLKAAVTGELTRDWREASKAAETGHDLLARFRAERQRKALASSRRRRATDAAPYDSAQLQELPAEWAWGTLDEVSLLVVDGDHNPPKRVTSGIPHLTAKNIKRGKVVIEGSTFVSEEGYKQTSARYTPIVGDILITCVGTVGEVAVSNETNLVSIDRNIAAVRLREPLSPKYLEFALTSPKLAQLMRSVSGSTAQPHLYLKDIRALPIPIPPPLEGIEILRRVSEALTAADDAEKQLEAVATDAARLKQSIQPPSMAASFRRPRMMSQRLGCSHVLRPNTRRRRYRGAVVENGIQVRSTLMKHTIEAAEKPLLDIFCDKYLFRIPSYQRPYAWTTEQTGELYDDVVSACGNNEDPASASPYFLGSIVLIKEPQKTDADVVDGQQRLTTLTILLSVLRDLADANFSSALQHHICQQGNPLTGAAGVFRLQLRERDAEFFQKTIQDDNATSSLPDSRQYHDAQARIVENAAYLRARLEELSDEQRRRLAIFIAQRCYLVVVAASDQESAFRVFSVLNSRGLDLSPTDILKAEIIGALPTASREDYTSTWEDIEDELGRLRFAELFGHIRTIHRQQKMQGTLIAEFREYVKARESPAKFIDSELSPYAEAYREITDKTFRIYKNADAINRELSHLARLDNFDWQPPAIEMIARRRDDPDLILRFMVDLERLAYALSPSQRLDGSYSALR